MRCGPQEVTASICQSSCLRFAAGHVDGVPSHRVGYSDIQLTFIQFYIQVWFNSALLVVNIIQQKKIKRKSDRRMTDLIKMQHPDSASLNYGHH